MKNFMGMPTKAEIIARFMRALRERFEEELEAHDEPNEEMLWDMVLGNEDVEEQEGTESIPSSGTVSPANSHVSAESGVGEVRGSSPISSESSSSRDSTSSSSSGYHGLRRFDPAPGPRHPRPNNNPQARQYGPVGIFEGPNLSRPITREGYWTPWSSNQWSPFQKYPWHPIDNWRFLPYQDVNNNHSVFINNPFERFFQNRPVSRASTLSSSASTLETTWSSSEEEDNVEEEEEEPTTRVPPVNCHWLVAYLRVRGIGFLMPPGTLEQLQARKVAMEAMSQLWIAPFQNVEDVEAEFEETS